MLRKKRSYGYIRNNGVHDVNLAELHLSQHFVDELIMETGDGFKKLSQLKKQMKKGDYIIVYNFAHISDQNGTLKKILTALTRHKMYVYSIAQKIDTRKTDINALFGISVDIESTYKQRVKMRLQEEKKALQGRNYRTKIRDLMPIYNRFNYLINHGRKTKSEAYDELCETYGKGIRQIQRKIKRVRDYKAKEHVFIPTETT